MKVVAKYKIVVAALTLLFGANTTSAGECDNKLFSVTINDSLRISDALENLADTCNLSLIVKDAGAKRVLENKLYFVKLKNATLRRYLDTILTENGLNYELENDRLVISYLLTRTFKVHYIASSRSGSSKTDIVVADADSVRSTVSGKGGSGISILSDDKFTFWQTVKSEVKKILLSASDINNHYTKVGDSWVGPDGAKWEYNPLEPIINPQAGLITVTGTSKQIKRVSRYVAAMTKQIKEQVLIDVKIFTVTLDNMHTTGIDWSQLYKLQNVTVDARLAKNSTNNGVVRSIESGVSVAMHASINELIKFLHTQGGVRAVSSPKVRTLNNQQAVISVGKELFYKTKTSTKLNGNTAEGEHINSVFAGVLLDITPEVDARGMITLKVNPSITETLEPVKGGGTRDMPPDLVRRQISSVITIKDGDHAILGGLISTRCQEEVKRVPLLGSIPLLESAFKRTTKIETTEEMVIVITPHIIQDNSEISLDKLGYRRLTE